MRNACKAAINLYYRKLLLAVPWGFFSGCVAKSLDPIRLWLRWQQRLQSNYKAPNRTASHTYIDVDIV